jgi:hypothetical protein
MRDGGLRKAELGREVAHAELRAGQRIEDTDPGGVAQDPEDLGQPFDGVGVEL